MQLQSFCVRLPIKLRIPYSQVADVAAVSREGWWSRVGAAGDFHAEEIGEHPQMPTRGWRHDILMTLRGGKTVKIKTVNSLGAAREIEQQLRHRLGLPEVR